MNGVKILGHLGTSFMYYVSVVILELVNSYELKIESKLKSVLKIMYEYVKT